MPVQDPNTGLVAFLKTLNPLDNDKNGEPVGLMAKIRLLVNTVLTALVWFSVIDLSVEDIAVLMLVVNAVLSVVSGTFIRDRATPMYNNVPADDPSVPWPIGEVPEDPHQDPEAFHG